MQISLSKVKVVLPTGSAKPLLPPRILFRIPELRIEEGKKLLIKGESGKGKTTLLHLIAGLFLPSEGTVEVGAHRMSHLGDDARCEIRRKHIGVVFQALNLLEHLTVRENVELALKGKKDAPSLATMALDTVGLAGRYDDSTSVLSLGEQQRVAVARVLARKPDLILADEPTSSLDEKNSRLVIDQLFAASQGKTLVVVSHDHRIEDRFQSVLRFEELIA